MRILTPSAFVTMPWKNGGGTTREIFVAPSGAAVDSFLLRVSAASVEKAGPFSTFSAVDRTLVVTKGMGLTLMREGEAPVTLDQTSAPFSFAGDEPCEATLVNGSIEDFNVMTRRDRAVHSVVRIDLSGESIFIPKRDLLLIAIQSGSVSIGASSTPIEPASVLVLERNESPVTLCANGAACVLRVDVEFLAT